jgi:hypothetical protein
MDDELYELICRCGYHGYIADGEAEEEDWIITVKCPNCGEVKPALAASLTPLQLAQIDEHLHRVYPEAFSGKEQ